MILDNTSPPLGTVRDWLDERARQTGDATAYEFCQTDAPLTWSELQNAAHSVASQIADLGVAKGDSVALMMPNSRAGIVAFFGAVYGGFRATMINLVAGDAAIEYALQHSEARVAFVHPSAQSQFDKIAPNGVKSVIPDEQYEKGALNDLGATDHALLMYTSGTTGRPKGVVHTQASLLAGGWTTCVAHDLGPSDRGLCVLPIYHINGLCVTVMGVLISGGSLAMADKFSASQFWAQADKHEITWFSVVPTIISHLLHGKNDPTDATKARIRFGRSASSALAPDVQTGFEKRFDVPIVETMGLTETSAQILSNPLPPGVRKIGSPGVCFGNEVAILRSDFSIADPMEQGEIAIRGPNVMLEYLKNPEATQDTFAPDGWLRSGDLGHMDADGYVFVTGRLKELIIKGGENIAPREIDEVLYSNEDVVEAAAFARPCKTYGERVAAAVALRENAQTDTASLISLCVDRLGAFKAPEEIFVMSELPKGPSGKIQRLQLCDLVKPN